MLGASSKLSRTWLVVVGTLLVAVVVPPVAHGEGISSEAAFDKLKGLEGTWTGKSVVVDTAGNDAGEEQGTGHPATHLFRVMAAGTVVMETMNPGSDHEMINVYHLDGPDLVLTHYCSGGNQPRMRMNVAGTTPSKLSFDFDGGTNLDPARDGHVHSGQIEFVDDGTIVSSWLNYKQGRETGTQHFRLIRESSG